MSKYTIIGDPHAKPDNLDKIEKLFDMVEALGNDTIWLGDFLDTKEVVRGKCLNLIYNCLKKSRFQHTILVGNHDWFNLECKDHSLQLLKELTNVVIIDEVMPLPYDANVEMYAMPYIDDEETLKKVIKDIPKGAILFGHFELKGFDFGNGHICTDGMTTRSFTKFKRVISGHFHKYQEKGNLTYLGTAFSHTFGESNQIKYIGIYDTDTDELQLAEAGFPQHVTIEMDCDFTLGGTALEIEDTGDYKRVILKGKQENIDRFNKAAFPEGTKFIEDATDAFNQGLQITETQSNEVKFETWARDIKQIDEETIKIGLEILGSVR